MARIFISYSRTDETFARRLAADLSNLGADVWIDVEDIPAGMNWSSAIQQGLDECEAMLVILSPDSMKSRNVENEWQYVLDHGYPIIPVLWRPTRVHFQLNRLQYIDFHEQEYDSALAQLHSELRRKGIALEPLTLADDSVQRLVQSPLPMYGEDARFPRSYLVIGVAVLAVIALAVILALSGVLGSGNDGDTSGALNPQEEAQTLIARADTLTAVAWTPTPSHTPSNTPNTTQTMQAAMDVEYTQRAHTLTAQPTSTFRSTNTTPSTAAPEASRTLPPIVSFTPRYTATPIATYGPMLDDQTWFRVLEGDPIITHTDTAVDAPEASPLEPDNNYRTMRVVHDEEDGPWYQVIDHLGVSTRWVNGPSLHQRIVALDEAGTPLPDALQPVDVPPAGIP